MEKCKNLRRYLMMLLMTLMLVLFGSISVFAAGNIGSTAEKNTGAAEETIKRELAKSVKMELDETKVVYNGSTIKVQVKYNYEEDGRIKDAAEVFIISEPEYKNNLNAGTATVTARITGYYEDDNGQKKEHDFAEPVELSADFEIMPADLSSLEVSAKLASVIYITDGETARRPSVAEVSVKLKSGTKKLSADDWQVKSVKYDNNVKAGTATAKIVVAGRGNNYTGISKVITVPFTISRASVEVRDVTYNGNARTPSVTVEVVGKTLKKNRDFKVTYKNNKNAGKGTAVIRLQGSYKGTLTENFTIKPRNISGVSVSLTSVRYSYNGKIRQPGTTVKIKLSSDSSAVTLKKGRDYTVAYSSNCKSIGTKQVVIKGKGNYTGQTKKYTYVIVPETPSGLKVIDRSSGALRVTCNAAKTSGCKYQFILKKYDSSSGEWVRVSSKKVNSNSTVFSGLNAATTYVCYVRIYKTIGSTTYAGDWTSGMRTTTSPSRPVMSYAVRTGSSSMKAVWKAVSAATGYEVQYSTKSDFSSNVKTVAVKGRTTTSKTISGLNSSGTYYVRVRAYRTYNGKNYSGSWSSRVSTYYSNVYASYTTYYNSGNTNRATNLRLACNAINGKILADGDTFSFNGIVGERTAAKGYKEAIIYEGGQEVGGIGGGICQVATTLFNAALKANFTIVERHQHSMTVHYCPLGYDAAISWGSKNLKFRNNSGTSVMIDIHASGGTLSVRFLTNVYKKPPAVTTKVTVNNGVYTLRRYVNGQVNYTTTSDYLDN